MADPTGFLRIPREEAPRRPLEERLRDWREVEGHPSHALVQRQATRCMDCGIPFCHSGCPLGNLIPEWNDLARQDRWDEALERLHATNNFPELTGRLCPAPCESACVLGIADAPVAIKKVEASLADHGLEAGAVKPVRPSRHTGKRVAVVGSGPAGLAAAQQLTRAGHEVTVFEADEAPGGLLRHGIPDFKLEKSVLDRRLALMEAEGTRFVNGCRVGVDLPAQRLRGEHDAVIVATGATVPRDLAVPGRELAGIHFAMEFLTGTNRALAGRVPEPPVSAAGRHVVILGGGDTGADCLGTAHRHGAASVTQLEVMPRPPDERPDSTPWPTWPMIFRTTSAHEEGGERLFSLSTEAFLGDAEGRVRALQLTEVALVRTDGRSELRAVEGTRRELRADLVLLAMGFTGAERRGLVEQLGLVVDARGNVGRDEAWRSSVDGVFVCGDAGRGQSLIVWAIAEGRACAASVDAWLMGSTELPAPVTPSSRPMVRPA